MSVVLTKPRPAAEHGGDLMREAWCLCDHGYLVAAVCTARVALETRLRAMGGGDPARDVRGVIDVALQLRRRRAISSDVKGEAVTVGKRMNLIAHGGPVDRDKATRVLTRTAWILRRLR